MQNMLPNINERLVADRLNVSVVRASGFNRVRAASSSPPEVQLEFLRGLMENEAEAKKFMADPKQYSVDHGVVLEPGKVKAMTDAVLFDVNIRGSVIEEVGAEGLAHILDMRDWVKDNSVVAAIPAAVVAGAAVVAAAAAVVEAVVTVVRTSIAADLHALRGVHGVRMPGTL